MPAAKTGLLNFEGSPPPGPKPFAAPDSGKSGLFSSQNISWLIQREMIVGREEIQPEQIQPASLDLRLGRTAYRVPASFLPGREKTVREQLDSMDPEPIDLTNGAVLEKGAVFLVDLLEHLNLQPSLSAVANPKSSTGRLDIFTRIITDHADRFDTISGGYSGPLYAEISPRSFGVKVRRGSRLNQIRFRRRNSAQGEHVSNYLTDKELRAKHEQSPLVDGEIVLREGVVLSLALSFSDSPEEIIGYKAKSKTTIIDVDNIGGYHWADFWEPIYKSRSQQVTLDPDNFYILASKEQLHIPLDLAAEMVPADPRMGEFRVHYAGFFDPGFGYGMSAGRGARAVLEVRSREVAFIVDHGQMVARLVYEKLTEPSATAYGQLGASNYQGQGLKLSKHFRSSGR